MSSEIQWQQERAAMALRAKSALADSAFLLVSYPSGHQAHFLDVRFRDRLEVRLVSGWVPVPDSAHFVDFSGNKV